MVTLTDNEFKELHETLSMNALSKKLGISRVTARKWAKRLGLPSKRDKIYVTPTNNNEIHPNEQG